MSTDTNTTVVDESAPLEQLVPAAQSQPSAVYEELECMPARSPRGYLTAVETCSFPTTDPEEYTTPLWKERKSTDYVAFFDFECTGHEPFALAIQVVGFPRDATSDEEFDRGIKIKERHVCAADLSGVAREPRFNASTKTWWMQDENKAARDYISSIARPGFDFHHYASGIVRFVDDMRAKYPELRFATDNPTLDAKYLDTIMDSACRMRISLREGGGWARVLAVDDLREGFQLATDAPIPKRPACPLRAQASGIPPHAPDGDVLQIAADYADLLVAAAVVKRRKIDGTVKT